MKAHMSLLAITFTTILLTPIVFSKCSEDQIDINSAEKEKIDELYGIGAVKALEIINSRPFKSVDELIRVKGIGEKTLNKIKEQGLACVDEVEKKENFDKKSKTLVESLEISEEEIEEQDLEVIKLNTKSIKTENSGKLEEPKKDNYAIYGFGVFCILLGFLFALKIKSKRNELQ